MLLSDASRIPGGSFFSSSLFFFSFLTTLSCSNKAEQQEFALLDYTPPRLHMFRAFQPFA